MFENRFSLFACQLSAISRQLSVTRSGAKAPFLKIALSGTAKAVPFKP
jgi:hypothetical protein